MLTKNIYYTTITEHVFHGYVDHLEDRRATGYLVVRTITAVIVTLIAIRRFFPLAQIL